MRVLLIGASALLLLGGTAGAQTQPAGPSKSGCAAAAAPATPPAAGATAGGTDPGNAGSTGFSGAGLGGAYTGTTPNGATAGSPNAQPVTAKGLDPVAGPAKPADKSAC